MSNKTDREYCFSQPHTKISQTLKEKIYNDFNSFTQNDFENIISFFSLNSQQQIELLPKLEKETKFCFSDGDLITDKTLLVLANEYQDMINAFLIRLMTFSDNPEDEHLLEDAMRTIYSWVDSQNWNQDDLWNQKALLKTEWILVRKLSQFIKHYLHITSSIDTNCLEKIIFNCLHP